MANYIVSAPDANRQIKTNISGLAKSIKTLLDEGYESVTVMSDTKVESITHKFEVGDKVRIVDNISSHDFSIGDIVEVIGKVVPVADNKAGYRMQNAAGDWWWVYESEVEPV